MSRLMGLDVGEKTIGVAMSDELQITTSPYKTIQRTASIKADLREVQRLIEKFEISKVIIGNPVMLSGEEAIQVEKVREFAERLARRLKIPVELWDERLTTVQAERILKEAGKTREERKKIIDSVAASIILKSYLDSRK